MIEEQFTQDETITILVSILGFMEQVNLALGAILIELKVLNGYLQNGGIQAEA